MKRNSTTHIKAACLFSGMGGFSAALKQEGVNIAWANELDPHACNTYRFNHNGVNLIEKDVRDLSVKKDKLQPVSILTAGFPCQSFSMAGNKGGFDDERGKCFYEIPRLLKEFGVNRPSILIMENVPNLLHGGNGLWFDEIISNIQDAGYWFKKQTCRVLNTVDITGIPQNRPRLFMVAFSTAQFPANFFQFPESGCEVKDIKEFINRRYKAASNSYLPTDNRYYKEIYKSMEEGDKTGIFQLRRYYARANKKRLCPALTANMGGGGHNIPFIKDRWGIRHLTVQECLELQGFDNYTFPDNVSDKERYKQIGNAVTVPLAAMLVAQAKMCLEEYKASVAV